mgnify:CR=1 FL=1
MELNYKKYGEANETLIIIHGFLGSLENWHTLATEFGKHFSIYTIDMRNHGKSPHTEHHSIELMVNDLAAFMDKHQIKSANILGHSMGGKTVMKLAELFPKRIKKMMVIDIAPRYYPVHHHQILNALK